MRKRNLWEKKETGRNIAIERGRQEENMEMEEIGRASCRERV